MAALGIVLKATASTPAVLVISVSRGESDNEAELYGLLAPADTVKPL